MSERNQVDCPRAKSWMTPCIARDGSTALTDPPDEVCVGCGHAPAALLADLAERYPPAGQQGDDLTPEDQAEALTALVAQYVEG